MNAGQKILRNRRDECSVVVSARVPAEVALELKRRAEAEGLTVGEVIREQLAEQGVPA